MGKLIDISNQKFGFLTVINKSSFKSLTNPQTFWECKCDCGKMTILPGQDLRRGHTTSCGCMKYELIAKKNMRDLSGSKFESLLVIKRLYKTKNDGWMWNCQCVCGKNTNVRGTALTTGNTKSCGCGRRKIGKI
jgi:hypothetical protein